MGPLVQVTETFDHVHVRVSHVRDPDDHLKALRVTHLVGT